MKRYLYEAIVKDLSKKMVLISGPRQVGKTTLSKALLPTAKYYNYDRPSDKKLLQQSLVNFDEAPLILDELHKMKQWKTWLKGHYDTRRNKLAVVVTGSAKLDTYKKVGDSMAGRYFQFRLMPLDVKEIVGNTKADPQKALEQLLELSGFPEPFLSGSPREYKRWRAGHLDVILKQDLPQTDFIKSVSSVELLVELMTDRVGSIISYNSLREDLSTDDKSVKRWFSALENSYVLFKVLPYSKKIQRAISKSPKYYFYDIPRVNSPGARFENLIALSIYKEILYRKDVLGEDYSLFFLRNTNQNEVDFLICYEKKPILMIEVKLSDRNLDHSFEIFQKSLGEIPKIILVKDLHQAYKARDGVPVLRASEWLKKMDF